MTVSAPTVALSPGLHTVATYLPAGGSEQGEVGVSPPIVS